MTQPQDYTPEQLRERAQQYFDRPSLSSPVFISETALAILDDRGGVPQVSIVEISSGEITPVTTFSERVLSLHGSLSGAIAFGMDHGGDERQQVWTWTLGDDAPVQRTFQPTAMQEPGVVSADGRTVLVKTNARDEATFDIVTFDIATGAVTALMENAGTAAPVALSKDGARALIVRSNTNLDADLWLVDLATSTSTNLTAHEGEAWILGAGFSTDETSVRYLTNEGTEFVRLVERNIESGTSRVLREDPNHDIEAFKVSPDGRQVAVAINEHGWSRVEIHSLIDRRGPRVLTELERGTVDRFTWSPDSTTLAFGFSTAVDPSRIVVVDRSDNIRYIIADSPLDRPQLATPELVTFPTFDGCEIPAFLFKPEGEGPFPVLVEIHGGPESQRRLQYSSAVPTDQFIQSLGIAVLSLNVRGSTGYGKTYSHLDDKHLRLDAVKDAVAAATWLRSRDDVIANRIGVMGQSYGGFMTLASIAFHPAEWAVAVDVVGIANFVSFLERTGPWRRAHRSAEYGFLERDRDMLEQISPLTHVDNITTPLFVIHGRNDPRVPLFEAEQIAAALESRGQEVVLRVFDDEGHGLSKRHNRIAGYAEAGGFLARHLHKRA